jgi:hypothetical protein
MGSEIVGDCCDCTCAPVDACGQCLGSGVLNCSDWIGGGAVTACNVADYCPDATPDTDGIGYGGTDGFDGNCEILDECADCGGTGKVRCDSIAGGTVNAGDTTFGAYCGDTPTCPDGSNSYDPDNDCPTIDGCGNCELTGMGVDNGGLPCNAAGSFTVDENLGGEGYDLVEKFYCGDKFFY